MVRAALVVVSVGFFVGATACSGRSTKNDDSSGDKSADAGESSGGSATGGSSGSSSGSGGTTQGGTSSGDDDGGPSGGTSTGGSSGTSPMGGTSPSGGAPTGGTAGSSTGGTAGDGGAAGEPSTCEGPAPGGCQHGGCPEGQTCTLASGACIPSRCDCSNGEWACTRDCGGGRCVDGSSCTTSDPSGCLTNDDCAQGEACTDPAITLCIPTGCACSPLGNTWECLDECNGGVCAPAPPDDCPANCEPQTSGTCGAERVTWVCTSAPIPFEEFMAGGCTDAGTQVPRYCCPPSFKPECQ